MYYTRELAPSWIAYGEVKVLKKFKNSEKGGEKPSKRARTRKTIFTTFGKGGQGYAKNLHNISPGTKSNLSLGHDDLVK